MLEFIGSSIPTNEMEEIVDSALSGAYRLARQARCNLDVKIIPDETNTSFDIVVNIVCDIDDIDINVDTVELDDNNSGVIGWGFVPHISTESKQFILDDENDEVGEATRTFKNWVKVAEFAQALAETEIYPYEYFD